MDDDRPPICPACGVTTVPAVLSSRPRGVGWICLECEETGDGGAESAADVQVGTERGWDAP